MANPFDFLNAINLSKKDLIREDPLTEKDYNPFMVNRGLSYFADTVMYANEMNRHSSIPKIWQNDFYLTMITKKKRFSKWHKKEANSKQLELVMEYYKYSTEKAQEVFSLLTEDQLKQIEQSLNKGGR
jgi:CRISPR/Cas system CSM-associated protein Csm2 small subunit